MKESKQISGIKDMHGDDVFLNELVLADIGNGLDIKIWSPFILIKHKDILKKIKFWKKSYCLESMNTGVCFEIADVRAIEKLGLSHLSR